MSVQGEGFRGKVDHPPRGRGGRAGGRGGVGGGGGGVGRGGVRGVEVERYDVVLLCLEFGVEGVGVGVEGLGFGVWGLGVGDSGIRI